MATITALHSTWTPTPEITQHRLSCKDGKVVIERVDPDFPRNRSDRSVIDQAAIDNLAAFLTLFHCIAVSGHA